MSSSKEIPSVVITGAESMTSESGSIVEGHSYNSSGSDESDVPASRFGRITGDIERFGIGNVRRWSDYNIGLGGSESQSGEEEVSVNSSQGDESVNKKGGGNSKFESLLTKALKSAEERGHGSGGLSEVNRGLLLGPVVIVSGSEGEGVPFGERSRHGSWFEDPLGIEPGSRLGSEGGRGKGDLGVDGVLGFERARSWTAGASSWLDGRRLKEKQVVAHNPVSGFSSANESYQIFQFDN